MHRSDASLLRMEAVLAAAEIFTHKFFAPPSYPGAVARQELLDRMFREPGYGVVVVQAPAGHGKSTLLQQAKTASAQRGATTGWLSFDEADNDLRRFTVHMQALINQLDSRAAGEADTARGMRRRLPDWIATRLAHADAAVHLFLDEFQTLSSRDVLTTFRELLERIPDNVTLFIGSRSLPEIGLARLVVNSQALVLRADDLRFSPQEAEQFFSQARDLRVSREELDTIYRQTEGWPAALQLFRLSLVSPSVRRSLGDLRAYRPRELAEYLADNVLSLQPPRIQEFLRRTSVLTRLSAALCDHVTGWQDSQSILLFLERSGLFLRSLDSDLRWFKYHTLFSSFLSEQVRSETPETLGSVHRSAAQWFYDHEMDEEAVYHAIAARDFVGRILEAAGERTELAKRAPGDTGFQPLEPLTDREKEILVYLANGVSNKEMARRIFVSENTVKFHLKNIYSKLAVGSRLQAINAARQMGLVA